MYNFPDKYKAAKLDNGLVTLEEKVITQENLNDYTLVIKVEFVGICRADVKEVQGSRDIPGDRGPLFGHEVVGKIVFAGTNTGFHLEQRVTFNPNITPDRTTGFSEYFIITGTQDVLQKAVIKIPDSITLNPPWSPEPLSATVRSFDKFLELSEMKDLNGKSIGFIGSGVAGTMIALYAKHYGANVKLFNRGKMRIDFLMHITFLIVKS